MERIVARAWMDRGRALSPAPHQGLRALRIAPGAICALRPGRNWKVLSTHEHAINFVDSSGRLLSLVQDPSRMGPFSIEVESSLPGDFQAGQSTSVPISFEGEARILIGIVLIDLTPATLWDPQPNWPALATIPWQPDLLPVVVGKLHATAPAGSLACVVELAGQHGTGRFDGRRVSMSDGGLPVQELPQRAAAAAAIHLLRSLAGGDFGGVSFASRALAGQGSGLTPSGDDFLIGVMFGVHSALPATEAGAISKKIHHASMGRTNRISEAWLAAAAEGQAIQAWHDLVEAILSHDRATVDRACQHITNLGHTSGADALTGFAAYHLARGSSACDSPKTPVKLAADCNDVLRDTT
jgi:hypothetical protein